MVIKFVHPGRLCLQEKLERFSLDRKLCSFFIKVQINPHRPIKRTENTFLFLLFSFQNAGWCLADLFHFKTLRPVNHQVLFNSIKGSIETHLRTEQEDELYFPYSKYQLVVIQSFQIQVPIWTTPPLALPQSNQARRLQGLLWYLRLYHFNHMTKFL